MHSDILKKIKHSREMALGFLEKLKIPSGYKYTLNHNTEKYPAAILYGTWSAVYLNELCKIKEDVIDKNHIYNVLQTYRRKDGTYLPKELENANYAKSKEYVLLHCNNYAVGACMILKKDFDFQSSYMDFYLNADNLERWLNQRSLQRPWEESNNIVNVASYLALCNEYGNNIGLERLYQMLEWHNLIQNPKTGGFENLPHSQKNILQSMAGAVHNFHIHHYLKEPMNYEKLIGKNVIPFLYEGPLTACLSIDFVELGCKALPFMDDKYELEQALLYYLKELLNYQNVDGGYFENETPNKPTTANGMKEDYASSNSYATWFRMCSIGMIATTILGDNPSNWQFRNTLGMGYFTPMRVNDLHEIVIDSKLVRKHKLRNLPNKLKNDIISLGYKLIK